MIQPGDRWFARIRVLDLECPFCSQVYQLGTGRGFKGAYDPTTGRFTCPNCGHVVQIGVLGYTVVGGPTRIPADWRVTYRIKNALRQTYGARWNPLLRHHGAEPVNRLEGTPSAPTDPLKED